MVSHVSTTTVLTCWQTARTFVATLVFRAAEEKKSLRACTKRSRRGRAICRFDLGPLGKTYQSVTKSETIHTYNSGAFSRRSERSGTPFRAEPFRTFRGYGSLRLW